MAELQGEIHVKVTADTSEVQLMLAELKVEFAAKLKEVYLEGYADGNPPTYGPEGDWNQSEAKKLHDSLLG